MIKICIELKNGTKMNAELYEDIAPITVKNFISLVDSGFYKDIVFHRIIDNFMCQAGGYYIDKDRLCDKERNESIIGEFNSNGFNNPLKHELGVLSMARTSDPNSAYSQFFICSANAPHLDGQYAAFGKLSDEESVKNLLKLSKIKTMRIGMGFENFPVEDESMFTIKDIYRI